MRTELELEDGVRPRRVRVGTSDAACALLEAKCHDAHNLLDCIDRRFCYSHDVDSLLAVFATVQGRPLVQQVVQLPTVDFVEADLEVIVREATEEPDDVKGSQEVQPGH